MKRVAIALGSNQGDRKAKIQEAVSRIELDLLTDVKVSKIYETEPWGILNQPNFLNAVITGTTEWKAPAIVTFLKDLERQLGRKTTEKNGPRVIDLDLLCVEDQIVEAPGVSVPHPGIQERIFVLKPFNDVWPEWKHPRLKKTVKEMLAAVIEPLGPNT